MHGNAPNHYIFFPGQMKKDASTQPMSGAWRDAARGRDRVPVDARILEMAEAEYERCFPPGQTIDRLRERAGLGFSEMVSLLASAVTRYAPPDALTPKSLTKPASGE